MSPPTFDHAATGSGPTRCFSAGLFPSTSNAPLSDNRDQPYAGQTHCFPKDIDSTDAPPASSRSRPVDNGGHKEIARMMVSNKPILENKSTKRSRKCREKKKLALDHAKESQANNRHLSKQDINALNAYEEDKKKHAEYQRNYRARQREAEDDETPSIGEPQSKLVYPAVPLEECPSLRQKRKRTEENVTPQEHHQEEPIEVPLYSTPFIPFHVPMVSNSKKKTAKKNQDTDSHSSMVDSEETNRLKLQLTSANEQANLKINRLKSQLTSANEQANLEINRLKSQLTSANEQATLVHEREDEIQKLKSQLATAKHKASQFHEQAEGFKRQVADISPAIARYKLEVRDLRPKLENETRKLREQRAIFDQTDIQCPICLGVMWHPMSLTQCRHAFCDNCLFRNIKEGKRTCPLCVKEITELPREDKPLRSLVEKVAFFLDGSKPPNTVFNEGRFRILFPQDVIYVQ